MVNKFNVATWIVILLSITNYFGWTSIPWILLKVPAAIIGVIWIWAIVVATVMIIVNDNNK
jgi:hypothetical protein